MYATICLTQLLDIKPALCSRIVSQGGVSILCKKLENVSSFELVEHVIKALDKISLENAYSILSANGLLYLIQLIEFFDYNLQVFFYIVIQCLESCSQNNEPSHTVIW